MNLTDIEKAVAQLSLSHQDLTKEFLRTLLEASGWEEKHIKEALIIFSARQAMKTSMSSVVSSGNGGKVTKEVNAGVNVSTTIETTETKQEVAPVKASDITFLRADGSEEGQLHVEEVAEKRVKEEGTVFVPPVTAPSYEMIKTETTLDKESDEVSETVLVSEEDNKILEPITKDEPESLIVQKENIEQNNSWKEIPDNLPLIPFESAPHVWSFGRYKNTFYGKQTEDTAEKVPKVVVFAPQSVADVVKVAAIIPQEQNVNTKQVETIVADVHTVAENQKTKDIESPLPVPHTDNEAIDFEKTPITKGDESLVVLASVMLLAIMLLLGYMYGKGRL